jgi:hypothetical protein
MDAHDPSNKIENWKSIQLMDVPNGCGTKFNELKISQTTYGWVLLMNIDPIG